MSSESSLSEIVIRGDEVDEIYTEDQLTARYGIKKKHKTTGEKVKAQIKKLCSCSTSKVLEGVQSTLPITKWIHKYKIKQYLIGDIVAGITVGVVHLPQGLAYSLLASLPPVTGLYVSFFPVLAYIIFGTSRHISIGTFAVISLMIGAILDELVSPSYCGDNIVQTTTFTVDNVTSSSSGVNCEDIYNQRKIQFAVALSAAVAIIYFIMYILRLGIVTVYMSSHMISAFTCGAAFHVMTSQVPKLFGLDIPRKSGPLAFIYTYIEIFSELYTINWATFIVSVCCIVVLMIGKVINEKLKAKLPFPVPWELAIVIFSNIASYFGYLNLNYGVSVVGTIPRGIQTTVPQATDLGQVFVGAIPIAIVAYTVGVSLSGMFANKHAYKINPNQELLAYGMCNLVGCFFSCFPCAASLSRSVIWDETGGKTQVTGAVSSVVVLVILMWIGPLFESLPEAALASIIVVNLKRMLLQFQQLPTLWKISRLDAIVWMVTWIAVILLGVDLGLLIGIGFSLITVILRTQLVKGEVLTSVGETDEYRNIQKYHFDDQTTETSILIFNFQSPLYFANCELFVKQLYKDLGFQPALEIAKRKKKQKRLSSVAVNNAFVIDNEDVTNVKSSDNGAKIKKQTNGISTVSLNCTTTEIKCDRTKSSEELLFVILEMKGCSFIDNDGMKCIKTLHSQLKELQIRLLLAQCSESARRCLKAGNFPPKADEDQPADVVFFISISKAVSYARRFIHNNGNDSGNGEVLHSVDQTCEVTRF